jgi:hypothetical protein
MFVYISTSCESMIPFGPVTSFFCWSELGLDWIGLGWVGTGGRTVSREHIDCQTHVDSLISVSNLDNDTPCLSNLLLLFTIAFAS